MASTCQQHHQMIVITGVWYSWKSDCNVFHSCKHISFLKLCLKHKMFENQDSLPLLFRHFAEVMIIAFQPDFVKLQRKEIGYLFEVFPKMSYSNFMNSHVWQHLFKPSCVVMLSWAVLITPQLLIFNVNSLKKIQTSLVFDYSLVMCWK